MESIELLGYVGCFLSSITFLPQVYKAWQTRRVADLSMAMILIIISSTLVWLVYSSYLKIWPVLICNAIICLFGIILLFFKLAFKEPV